MTRTRRTRSEAAVADGGIKKATKRYNKPKKYVCTEGNCTKKFVDSTDLRRHQETHDPRKKKRCAFPGCDRETHQVGNLRLHIFSRKHSHLTLEQYNALADAMQALEARAAAAEAAAAGLPFNPATFESRYIKFDALPEPSATKPRALPTRRTSSWTSGVHTDLAFGDEGNGPTTRPFHSPKGTLGTLYDPTNLAIQSNIVDEPLSYDSLSYIAQPLPSLPAVYGSPLSTTDYSSTPSPLPEGERNGGTGYLQHMGYNSAFAHPPQISNSFASPSVFLNAPNSTSYFRATVPRDNSNIPMMPSPMGNSLYDDFDYDLDSVPGCAFTNNNNINNSASTFQNHNDPFRWSFNDPHSQAPPYDSSEWASLTNAYGK
ncbi:hypothetical protein BDN70DRAFT_130289 [Pholiota conissans]|uniref:C2H2-type domain-containing protein n=1 Tax=Pholiota conissans TaxID=109636 RepID=A0A9P5YXS2_9AGAR|nr:hypothetical protein BDN70DRAFT_130289 [Pholiota conissans]